MNTDKSRTPFGYNKFMGDTTPPSTIITPQAPIVVPCITLQYAPPTVIRPSIRSARWTRASFACILFWLVTLSYVFFAPLGVLSVTLLIALPILALISALIAWASSPSSGRDHRRSSAALLLALSACALLVVGPMFLPNLKNTPCEPHALQSAP